MIAPEEQAAYTGLQTRGLPAPKPGTARTMQVPGSPWASGPELK